MNPWTASKTVRGLEHGREGRDWDSCACSDCRRGSVRRPSSRYMGEKWEVSPKLKHGASSSEWGKKSLWRYFRTVISCSETLWALHAWRMSRPCWMKPWVAWSEFSVVPALSRILNIAACTPEFWQNWPMRSLVWQQRVLATYLSRQTQILKWKKRRVENKKTTIYLIVFIMRVEENSLKRQRYHLKHLCALLTWKTIHVYCHHGAIYSAPCFAFFFFFWCILYFAFCLCSKLLSSVVVVGFVLELYNTLKMPEQ